MKRILFFLGGVLLFSQALIAQNYNFSVVSPSGHTLYYRIDNTFSSPSVIVCPPTTKSAYEESWEFTPYPFDMSDVYPAPTGSLIIPNTVSWGGTLYSVAGIDSYAFSKCTGLTSVTLPNNLIFIGIYAFYNCTLLSSINIPNTVQHIYTFAFANCYSLTTISLPNSLDGIWSGTFQNCSGLTTVTMPSTMSGSIGEAAFQGCSSLTAISIPQGIVGIGNGAFQSCSSLATVLLPQSLSAIGANAFAQCTSITDIVIPDYVLTIGSEAFRYCSILKHVTLGKNVNYIENYAFANNANNDTIRFRRSEFPPEASSYWTCSQYCFKHTSENRQIRFEVPCGMVPFYRNAIYNNYSTSNPVYAVNINNLTALSSNNNHGTAVISRPASCDSAAIVNAIPTNGYRFTYWGDGDTNNPRSINVTCDTTVTAYFAANMCQINVSSNNPSYGYVTGGGTFIFHDTVEIRAFPNAHYHFIRWSDGNTDNPRQYIVNGDANIVATFAIDTHSVTVTANNIAFGNTTGGGSFPYGTATTVSASAYSGYQFVQWSNGETSNPYTFAVLNDMSLTAIFLPTHTVNVASANPSMGTVSGGGQFAEGATCTITAISNSGYQFDHWQDGNTDNPRNVIVTSDATFVAYFVPTQGINETNEDSIKVYSCNGKIIVEGIYEDVRVFDMVGRNVRNETLSAGVYMVKVDDYPAHKVVVIM